MGLLTVSNDVNLTSTATTVMKIDKTAGTNDALRVTGNLNYDGMLTISNLSTPLAGGDSFQLFNAAASTGNFAGISGSPGAGLDWKFNPANGSLDRVFDSVDEYQREHCGRRVAGFLAGGSPGLAVAGSDQWGSGNVGGLAGDGVGDFDYECVDPTAPALFFRLVYP